MAHRTLPGPEELRARRRAARAEVNRGDILDAAERAFAARGLDGSLRDIASRSGFSTAAIYNYFESKDQLFAETLSRRGVELLAVIEEAAATEGTALAKLHAVVDASVDFFARYPDFGRMLWHVRSPGVALPPIIAEQAGGHIERFSRMLELLTGIIEAGQADGELRGGAAPTLLHLYMTIVYEHVFLVSPDSPAPALTQAEFHDLVDAMLRRSHP